MNKTQLELNFESGLTEQYATLMDCVRSVVHGAGKPLKTIAADIDKSQSDFSRELAENPNDNRFLKVHDLSQIIASCGPRGHEIIYWLIEKHLEDPTLKKERAKQMIADMLPKLEALLKAAS